MTRDITADGGKRQNATAPRRDESADEQTEVRVRCTESDCDHDETHTGSRNMAIARAMMDAATHEHPTEREFVNGAKPSTVTITGPDMGDINAGGGR